MLYLDYAATTPVRPEVREIMQQYFAEEFANPHSPHDQGLRVHGLVEEARQQIAAVMGVWPQNLVFTSGGTEGNNMAIFGTARVSKRKGLLTTGVEHKSVLGPVAALEKEGYTRKFIPVDNTGLVDLDSIQRLRLDDIALITLGHANNEVGTVQPIAEIAQLVKSKGVMVHCDAVQSFGKIMLHPAELGVHLMSLSGHKIYGPKGIGVLYLAPGVKIKPLQYGGGQEKGLRPGTLNVPAIMGLAKAIELAAEEMVEEGKRQTVLRDRIISEALQIDGAFLNGHHQRRLPNNVNIGIERIEGQVIVAELARRGISISTGAACSSGSSHPSHVLSAMGQPADKAYAGFRITLGRYTSEQDISSFMANLREVVQTIKTRYGF